MRFHRMWPPIVALVVVAFLLTVLVRLIEPRLAFFPTAGETATPRSLGTEYEAVTIRTADGEQLHAWELPHPAPRALVVYFHGNGGNLSIWAPILAGVARHGYAVLAFDYRGYGRSTGRPSERGLYGDVNAVVERAWSDGNRRIPVIYWGRSLGATMAAYGATVRPPQALILESGFPDARALVGHTPPLAFLSLFSTYHFPTAEFVRRVNIPTLVMHGDNDQVIPFAMGQALFEQIGGSKQFVTIRGGDHNDLAPLDEGAYWGAVGRFIDEAARTLGQSDQANAAR